MNISLRNKIGLIVFGICVSIVVLEIGLRFLGGVFSFIQESRNRASVRQKGEYRILCLGESTTAGGQGSYPAQLEEIINRKVSNMKVSVINKGIPGTRTPVIVEALPENIATYKPQMIIAMMGINDGADYVFYKRDYPIPGLMSFFSEMRTYKLMKLLWKGLIIKSGYIFSARVFNRRFSDLFLKGRICFAGVVEEMNAAKYIELAKLYRQKGELSLAEEHFKKAVDLEPYNDWLYLELAMFYNAIGNNCAAEEYFVKVIELNPKNERVYYELGWFYKERSDLLRAEENFKKTIDINPTHSLAQMELGFIYAEKNEFLKAEAAFKKSIDSDPDNVRAYIGLGWFYFTQKDVASAENVMMKAAAINLTDNSLMMYRVSLELGYFYLAKRDYINAEKVLKSSIASGNKSVEIYGALGRVYQEMGDKKAVAHCENVVKELRNESYNYVTKSSYLKLKEIADREKIKLVCVQYPMRGLFPLKKIFNDSTGIIFVDNETIFKDAVKDKGYAFYFVDMFAGDFGHCTYEGNRLLASNIAATLLKLGYW